MLDFDMSRLLPDTEYFAQAQAKDLIVLHFTAGRTADSAINSWVTSPVRVSTAFVVDTNATVFQVFAPKYWAYHLGIEGRDSQQWKHDKRSVGIEIANVGPLVERKGWLYWWPPAMRFEQPYCALHEKAKYVKVDRFRGYSYFATFTAEQVRAVAATCKWLNSFYGVSLVLPPVERRTHTDLEFFSEFQGIASHQNFRRDKCDIGPAWDWDLFQRELEKA